jgi:hypothetical protein
MIPFLCCLDFPYCFPWFLHTFTYTFSTPLCVDVINPRWMDGWIHPCMFDIDKWMNDIHPRVFDVIINYKWLLFIDEQHPSIMDRLQFLINGFKIHLSKNDMHPWWWTYVMNKCFPSYIMDDIHACMNFIYPRWTDVNCPSKVGMNQPIMRTSIHLYNMSILWYILCMVFHWKLMNVIQSRDNHQCMVLVYFDTLFAMGRTWWKCNLKRQSLNLIIYNMTRILLRPNNTNGNEHTCRKLCLGLDRYLELWFNNGMLSLTVANYKGFHTGSHCNLVDCREKLKSK